MAFLPTSLNGAAAATFHILRENPSIAPGRAPLILADSPEGPKNSAEA
jgi:hypothetical protein